MTGAGRAVAERLHGCTMLPGSWEKRFARDMAARAESDPASPLTPKQTEWLWRLAHRYRRQMFRDGERLTAEQVRRHFERVGQRVGQQGGGAMTEAEWLAGDDP